MATFRKHFLYAALGYLVLNLFLFGDVLFGGTGQVLSSSDADLYLHFAAWRQFGFDQLRQGHLVLWNPHYLCGNPFLGNFESALLYPLNWLCLFLPMALALNLGIVLHVVLAGLFTYGWASYRKLHPLAAFLSGILFMWGGAYYLHLYAGHLPNLCAMTWAPLIFWAIDGWVEEGDGHWVLMGVAGVSLQVLAGHPQYVYFTGLVAIVYFLLRLSGNPQKLQSLAGFFLFYLGAFFLTAAQSWTGLEAFLHSARHQALDQASAGVFSFPPQNLLTLFMPEFFGRLEAAHYWSSWYFWEGSLFLGVIASALIFSAFFQVKERKWLGTMAFVTVLLAMGAYTPLYPVLYRSLPFLSGVRGMGKFIFLASLFLSILAGVGFDVWLKEPRKIPKPWVFLVPTVLLLLFSRFVFSSSLSGDEGAWAQVLSKLPWLSSALHSMAPTVRDAYVTDRGIQAAWCLAKAGVMGLIFTICIWFSTYRRSFLCGVVLLAAFELFFFARASRPTFEWTTFQTQEKSLTNFFEQRPGDDRTYGLGAMALNTSVSDIWENEPIIPERYARFVEWTQGIPEGKLYASSPVFTRFDKIFGLVRLKYLMISEGETWKAQVLPFPTLPRMALISRWTVQSNAQDELKTLTNKTFDGSQQVLLEKEPGIAPTKATGRSIVHWNDRSTDEVEVEVRVPSPQVLLITDNYDPGWEAQALPGSDQKEYQVLPGDYFLRAVPLQAGYHHFILRYRPWAFEVGKWVSLLSCVLYVAILLTVQRPKFRPESSTIV